MLVDTSVWIDHFHRSNADLGSLLENGRVVMHPFVMGELACGSLHRREEVLSLLRDLPAATMATNDEVMEFVERHQLYGSGIGWIDAHLLASARLSHQPLWSTDRRLRAAAEKLSLV